MSVRDYAIEIRETPELMDARRVLPQAVVDKLMFPGVHYFRRVRAWGVDARDEREAVKLADSLQKKLLSKKAVASDVPFLHHLALVVAFPGGILHREGLPEVARKTGISDAKYRILTRAGNVFGKKYVSLNGSEGAYELRIVPGAREWRGKFAAGSLRGSLDEIATQLAGVFAKLGIEA